MKRLTKKEKRAVLRATGVGDDIGWIVGPIASLYYETGNYGLAVRFAEFYPEYDPVEYDITDEEKVLMLLTFAEVCG